MPHKVLDFAHSVASQIIRNGDDLLDATLGNGHDASFLLRHLAGGGMLWGFDVQARAIRKTMRRLEAQAEDTSEVILVRDSHEAIGTYVSGQLGVALFNLGWLPGASHHLVTRPKSTEVALNAAADRLRPDGAVIIVVYTGHEGGAAERTRVLRFAEERAQRGWGVVRYGFSNRPGAPPEVMVVRAPPR